MYFDRIWNHYSIFGLAARGVVAGHRVNIEGRQSLGRAQLDSDLSPDTVVLPVQLKVTIHCS
jgi:hypothetical protein